MKKPPGRDFIQLIQPKCTKNALGASSCFSGSKTKERRFAELAFPFKTRFELQVKETFGAGNPADGSVSHHVSHRRTRRTCWNLRALWASRQDRQQVVPKAWRQPGQPGGLSEGHHLP